MSLQENFEKFQENFRNLDPDNIGSWPLPVKIVCWLLAMVAVVVLSYQGVLRDEQASLQTERQKEQTLRAEFELKVQDAANIDAYRSQMKDMTESFKTLLGQLPKDTEVPGLLDDISEKGQGSGLSFDAIDLQPERKTDFYVELPISIKVKGGYHDFGTFISGVAGLPRIVTLHDFIIQSSASDPKKAAAGEPGADIARGSEELTMTITARTYRYKSADDADQDVEKAVGAKTTPKAKAAAAGSNKSKGGKK
jgi:type IV pilus assembly protein PilO